MYGGMYGAGKALSEELLHKVEADCDMALQLDEDKQQVRRCGSMLSWGCLVLLFCHRGLVQALLLSCSRVVCMLECMVQARH
jgi:hypothetical protein